MDDHALSSRQTGMLRPRPLEDGRAKNREKAAQTARPQAINDKNVAGRKVQAARRIMIPKIGEDHGQSEDREGNVGFRGAGALGSSPTGKKPRQPEQGWRGFLRRRRLAGPIERCRCA
jgi:hypothetical protein